MELARPFRSALVAGVALSVLGAAGCSSTGSIEAVGPPVVATLASLRQAAEQSTAADTSGRFEITMSTTDATGAPEMSLTMTGSRIGDRNQMSMRGDLGPAMTEELGDLGELGDVDLAGLFDMDLVTIGADAYLRGGMFAALFGGEGGADGWIKLPAEGSEDLTSDMPASPDAMTGLLDGALGPVTRVGEEEIRGVATTHYRVDFDGSGLGDLFGPTAELPDAEPQPLDVYVDAQGRMRRMSFELTADGATMSMVFDCYDLGATDIVIEAPAGATELDPADLFGGLGDLGGD